MKEHGLIFGAVSMLGILKRDKTMTRRVVSFHNSVSAFSRKTWDELDFDHAFVDQGPSPLGNLGPYLQVPFPKTDGFLGHERHDTRHRIYPRVQVGDTIRCKEAWAVHFMYDDVPAREARSGHPDDNVWYRADGDRSPGSYGCPAEGRRGKWRSSLFMPRRVSRAFLPVTEVVAQRVQEISEADARAEGVLVVNCIREKRACSGPDYCFHHLWDSINAPRGHPWSRNDWTWGYRWKEVTR